MCEERRIEVIEGYNNIFACVSRWERNFPVQHEDRIRCPRASVAI
jgi:hypothetical protein